MKKIFVYLLVGVLTISVVFSNYYKSAHAMEWVSGALSFSEVLTWLLASVGITCTITDYAAEVDKSRAEFWEEYEQKFYEDVELHYGVDTNDIKFKNWIKKLCEGTLDKSSEYWTYFKEWAYSLFSTSSSSPSLSQGVPFSDVYSYMMSSLGNTQYLTYTFNNTNYNADTIVYGGISTFYGSSQYPQFYFFLEPGVYSVNNNGFVFKDGSRYTGPFMYSYDQSHGSIVVRSNTSLSTFFASLNMSKLFTYYVNWISPNLDNYSGVLSNVSGDVASGDEYFDSVTSNTNNLDVISSDGVDEDNPEVSLPYPGLSDSDNEASKDAYQDIIDAINDGTITQKQGIEKIQEILRIITYDTVTDKVIPPQVDPDTGEDKTKDDVLKENKNNMGFTLAGLENVFPFCIPFDIYAFMTLLVAEPEAPEIDFPIKSVNGEVEEIHLDLSPFDSVAMVVRYIFDFLFIIGLGILTRSLIGGGSSD